MVADQYDEDTIVIPAQVAKVQQGAEDTEEEIENVKAEESAEGGELISVE